MIRQLQRTAQAEGDLFDIWSYIARDSPAAADRLLDRLDNRSRLLADEPDLGTQREDLGPGLRSFPVGSYLIIYRQQHESVEVVRYLHGRRDIRRLLLQSGS